MRPQRFLSDKCYCLTKQHFVHISVYTEHVCMFIFIYLSKFYLNVRNIFCFNYALLYFLIFLAAAADHLPLSPPRSIPLCNMLCISFFTTSMNLLCGLPLSLSILPRQLQPQNLFLIYPISLLCTCLSLASLTLSVNCSI